MNRTPTPKEIRTHDFYSSLPRIVTPNIPYATKLDRARYFSGRALRCIASRYPRTANLWRNILARTIHLTARVEPETKARLLAECKKRGVPMSELLHSIIADHLLTLKKTK